MPELTTPDSSQTWLQITASFILAGFVAALGWVTQLGKRTSVIERHLDVHAEQIKGNTDDITRMERKLDEGFAAVLRAIKTGNPR